jgi:biotin synthase
MELLERFREKALSGEGLDKGEAAEFSLIPDESIFEILSCADSVRRHFKGRAINLCSIVNAKSGLCKEDCSFCSQSARYSSGVEGYPMLTPEKIIKSARKAQKHGAREFSIVTSGLRVSKEKDLSILKKALGGIKNTTTLETCASLGIVNETTLKELKNAGLESYHHNLETSREFFPALCTTHDWQEDYETVKTAKALGLHVCSGGIFGCGEGWTDRVSLALTLRKLAVDSVPVNFLNPRPGTPLEGVRNLTPLECLKIIALFRFVLPDKDIIVCGGRMENLRDLHPLIFAAGANGMLTGDYLTTKGRDPAADLDMLKDLRLEPGR